jgi:hypothetical protein
MLHLSFKTIKKMFIQQNTNWWQILKLNMGT